MRSRFVIVDPSFTAHDGDRWHYAVSLARDAYERDYEVVLLTHLSAPEIVTSLPKSMRSTFTQKNIFPHTFFEHGSIYSRHRNAPAVVKQARRSARLHARYKLVDANLERARERNHIIHTRRLEWRRSTLEWLVNIRALQGWAVDAIASLRSPLLHRNGQVFNADDFASALAKELKKLSLSLGDRLFFHTMTYGMLESLSEVTQKLQHQPPIDCDAYFLFHFGADAPDAKTFLDRYYSYSTYGSIADRLRVGSPFRRLHFLATSDVLCDEAARIIGRPVRRWFGLVDPTFLTTAVGDESRVDAIRRDVAKQLDIGEVRIVVRAADLDAQRARAVSRACHLAQHRGNVVRLRILYHNGSLSRLRDCLSRIDFPNVDLIDTTENSNYLREMAQATLVILPYEVEKYVLRVSGVQHDCATLGVPCIVPYGTTLAYFEHSQHYIYSTLDDLIGTVLYALRHLRRFPDGPVAHLRLARRVLAGNAVDRLLNSSPNPAQVVLAAAPVANVVMPAWNRVGSSFAMEGQVRHLISRGYFVNQVFVMEKPIHPLESIEHLWNLLRENSFFARGNVQRIAIRRENDAAAGLDSQSYLGAGAFNQLLIRAARAKVDDSIFNGSLRRAKVTIVNHVFNASWAFKHTSGKRIIETHDIQSYQLIAWPLLDDATGQPGPLAQMLQSEMECVSKFDHVVNVAPEEHLVLLLANRNATLITPYIPTSRPKSHYASVAAMGQALGWHESYASKDSFDLLIAGDLHPANRESAIWFVNEVFKPLLSPLGVSLALAGRVSDVVHAVCGPVANLFYVGFVDNIESVRAMSRIAILPDRRGTGISIKTLEAFANGMPFVGTSVAFRGITGRLPDACVAYDQPKEMADEILFALRDKTRLNQLGALARQCYLAVASEAQHGSAWDLVLADLGLPLALPDIIPLADQTRPDAIAVSDSSSDEGPVADPRNDAAEHLETNVDNSRRVIHSQ